ncbi:DNA-directed RNA polymerase, beta subunit, partial [Vibrio parahaemolyticus AQ3810]|jgi:hypothetical protein
VTRV